MAGTTLYKKPIRYLTFYSKSLAAPGLFVETLFARIKKINLIWIVFGLTIFFY